MVNKKALDRSKQKRENRAKAYKKTRHRIVRFEGKEPNNIRFPFKPDWYVQLGMHKNEGDTFLFPHKLCKDCHYGEKCKICPKKTQRGYSCRYQDVRAYLVYNLDREGEKYERDGKKYLCNPFEILLVSPGREDVNWDKLDEAAEKGYFQKKVFQFKKNGKAGMLEPVILQPEDLEDYENEGKPVKNAYFKQVAEYTFEDVVAHILNAFDDVDFEYFEVDEPNLEDDEAIEADSDDEDSEDDDRPRRKKSSSKTSRRSRDEDDDDDEDSEDEDDDERPARRSKGALAKKISRTRDDDDEDDGDDEEDERPARRPSSKSSAKPKPKTKSSRRVEEDEDEDDSDDDDDEDDGAPPSRRHR